MNYNERIVSFLGRNPLVLSVFNQADYSCAVSSPVTESMT